MTATPHIIHQDIPPQLPPWLLEDAFPLHPLEHPYGHMVRGKLVPCTQEELILICRETRVPAVHLVWTPASPRLVPPTEVPFLFDAVRSTLEKNIRVNFVLGAFGTLIWGSCSIPSLLNRNHAPFRSMAILMLILNGFVPLGAAIYLRRKLRSFGPLTLLGEAHHHRYTAWVATRAVCLAWIFSAVIILLFVLQIATGLEHSVQAAGLVKPAVRNGQLYRLFTAPLLHGSLWHIAGNAAALFGLAQLAEVLAHRAHLALVFLLAALTGSLFSMLLLPNETSVGASGGIMGLVGFFAVVGYRHRLLLPPGFLRSILLNVALVVAMGVLAWDLIDNAAHTGGFFAGVLLGCLLVSRSGNFPLRPSPALRIAGAISLLLLALDVLFTASLLLKH